MLVTMLRRVPALDLVAGTVAKSKHSKVTATTDTIANVTCELVPG
jgi:hypothetical protein